MGGATSALVLGALLAAGVDVRGVVLAAGRFARATRPEPIVALPPPLLALRGPGEPSAAQLAHGHGIALLELRHAGEPATLQAIAALRPDIACVACFPLRLPAPLLAIPPLGFLNMHPSLLPRHRGPAPLFWAFRAGEHETGVTIHRMDENFDTGPIALQSPVALPDGIGGDAAERACSRLGAELMVAALRSLGGGTLALQPQPPGGGYEPWPASGSWWIEAIWTARRAFNFMRGTESWGQLYRLRVAGRDLALAGALSFAPDAVLGAPLREQGETVQIQMSPGVLCARLAWSRAQSD